jgi:hypothetical protein
MNQRTTLTYAPAIFCSEVKFLLMRLAYFILENVLAVAAFSNSALKNPSVKGIHFSCSQAII